MQMQSVLYLEVDKHYTCIILNMNTYPYSGVEHHRSKSTSSEGF